MINQTFNEYVAPASRLSFADEHLSQLNTAMDSAMESGENAAFHLLDL